MKKRALALVTHPDDAEFLCAGTMALLGKAGWELHMATMTAGDCGSKELSREEISAIRREEASDAAKLIDARYQCLEFDDMFICYDRLSILRVLAYLRKIRPHIVLTMSPDCYMVDHEITSTLVRTACFASGMTNMKTQGFESFEPTPYLYYLDPIEGKDKFGNVIEPTTIVDISSVMDVKSDMLACHASQREWLQRHHGMDQYLIAMKEQGEMTGAKAGMKYAEGFRQHLGHAYPQDNLLLQVLQQTAQAV
ncbi:MAG: PIG-L domain-containing protein [Cyclobacteriaceae bacterium]|nr:MAG: PIG-L domain-containing protein [Cyclobacteriaceae bacterium]